MARAENPRTKQVMDAAVRHLYAFAREVDLTPAGWLIGIQFRTVRPLGYSIPMDGPVGAMAS